MPTHAQVPVEPVGLPHRSRDPDCGGPRPPPVPVAASVLQLQRLVGNQATTAMLRSTGAAVPLGPPVVQRSPGRYDDEGLDLQVSLDGTSVSWFFAPDTLSTELRDHLAADPASRVAAIETAIDGALHDEAGPVHESSVYLESPPVAERLRRDLRSWPSTRALPEFSGWVARRAASRQQTALLYTLEQLLEVAGTPPASIDWTRELPALRAAAPIEADTMLDASQLDRYDHVLAILARESAGSAGSPDAPLHTAELSALIWDTYVAASVPPPELGEDFVRLHSEAFLEHWLPAIEGARFVPEDFDLEALRPTDTDELDEEREYLLAAYLGGPAEPTMQMFLLDSWVGDPLARSTEGFLAGVDLVALREDLLDHLVQDFLRWAARDTAYRLDLWDAVARQTAFDGIVAMVMAGRAAESYNGGLAERFSTVGPADLDADEWAIANDPAGYLERTSAAADATRDLLSGLRPDQGLEMTLTEWYQRAFATLPTAEPGDALVAGSLLHLFRSLANLGSILERERTAARDRIRDELDTGYEAIAAVIRDQTRFADDFIANEWLPMLKLVALEQVDANKEQLEAALADWPSYREQTAAKFNILVHVLDDFIEKLESGDYESIELDGQLITVEDVEQLRVVREFCLGQVEAVEDPDKAEETRDQMQEAIDGFASVRANIETEEYEPVDYASAVYDEARARLALSWYSDYTTLRSALARWEVVPENPFLAYAIASWQWNERVRQMDEQAAVFTALGLLTVASLVVPGVGGLVIGAVDLAVGIGMGIAGVDDAQDLLALARLDTDGTVRGITVEQAEAALHTAWLNLGLSMVLVGGIGALFGRLLIKGRAAAAIPGDLVRMNALMRVDPVAAEQILARFKDAYKAEEMLELVGDSRLLQRLLESTSDVRHLEYVLMSGEAADIARLIDLAGDTATLARLFDHAPNVAVAERLLTATDDIEGMIDLVRQVRAESIADLLERGDTVADLGRVLSYLDDPAQLPRVLAHGSAADVEALLARGIRADDIELGIGRPATGAQPQFQEVRLPISDEVRTIFRRYGVADAPLLQQLATHEADRVSRVLISNQLPGKAKTMETQLAQWALDGAQTPGDFFNRWEQLRLEFRRIRSGLNPADHPNQPLDLVAAQQLASDAGIARLNQSLEAGRSAIRELAGAGWVQLPGAEQAVVRAHATRLTFGSDTAGAYHAGKHLGELPLSERPLASGNTAADVSAYVGSARRTIRDGAMISREESGGVVEMAFSRVVTEEGVTYTMTARVLVRENWGLVKTYTGTSG